MKIVEGKRNIYIPSRFAKESLLYLQEVGESKTLANHTNSREKLDSFLFFIVKDGNGLFKYNGESYRLSKGNYVFIDCSLPFSHTSDNWTIAWVHFNGYNVPNIYNRYLERNGLVASLTNKAGDYENLIDEIYNISTSDDYLKDMSIYNMLTSLLLSLMSETSLNSDNSRIKKYNISEIKDYLDDNYKKDISLHSLEDKFFINRFYLTRLFKNTYGITINDYIAHKRISKAKELIRFSKLNIEEIAMECGYADPNYFSRVFKKIEGISPHEYKNAW